MGTKNMRGISSYRDLEVWQFAKEEWYGMTRLIRRASDRAPADIARPPPMLTFDSRTKQSSPWVGTAEDSRSTFSKLPLLQPIQSRK